MNVMQVPEPFTRPDSGIRIYEIQDSSEANPHPDSDNEKSFGEFLSPIKLKQISGCSNLFDVMELKLKLDTAETSIGNLGSMVPNLRRLNLNNSYIMSIRDLGTTLNNLSMLWLCRCSLVELDGISCFGSLRELFIAYNEISDLSSLSMVDTLEVLDLEGNNVDDITQVEFLSLCGKLTVLTLRGNPVETSPTPYTNEKDLKFYCYQDTILSCLPALKVLDDERLLVEKINGKEVKRANPNTSMGNEETKGAFKKDLKILQESLKTLQMEGEEFDDCTPESEGIDASSFARPMSAQVRCQSSKPQILCKETTSGWQKDGFYEHDDCSNLTNGQIMCGNPVAALRKRNRTKKQEECKRQQKTLTTKSKNIKDSNHPVNNNGFKPEHSYLTPEEVASDNKEDILEELRQWRMNNQALFENSEVTQQLKGASSRVQDPRRKSFSPTPPSKPKPNRHTTRMRRSLQSPVTSPMVGEDRPHTVAEFRSKMPFDDLNVDWTSPANEVNKSLQNIDVEFGQENYSSHFARPSTARAALQSLQRPHNRLGILPGE